MIKRSRQQGWSRDTDEVKIYKIKLVINLSVTDLSNNYGLQFLLLYPSVYSISVKVIQFSQINFTQLFIIGLDANHIYLL